MSVIENLEPKLLWKHFDEIRKIPRCSKHEEKIREYVENFAQKHNLKYKTDKIGNIIILKPATSGMEKKPIVILQGHMDMVCEKNSDVDFDFAKDSIKLKRDGDILSADGTTLGADNGIGLATSLAILEDNTLKHGPIEALFRVDSVEKAKTLFETLKSAVGSLKRTAPKSLNEVVQKSSSLTSLRQNREEKKEIPEYDRMKKLAGI